MNILFYPDRVDDDRISRMYRILRGCDDISFCNDPSKPHDLHIFWSYTPHSIVPDDVTLNSPDVINRGCWDISKVRVDKVFDSGLIHPMFYRGLCVEKADLQGKHRYHRLVRCPVKPKDGYVYQKYYIDKEGHLYISYRVYYAGGITHVVRYYKKDLFKTQNVRAELVDKREVFTRTQEDDFINRCTVFGFDLGEVDVVMDEGVPVVVDINNVPSGRIEMTYKNDIDKSIKTYLYDKASKVQQGCQVL